MYILLLACQRQVVQSLMDEPIVVVTRDLVIAPEIEPEQIVETQRGLFPLLVRLGMPEDVEPELRGSLAAPPGEEPLVSKMVASAWSHVVMFARSTVSECLSAYPAPKVEDLDDNGPYAYDDRRHRPHVYLSLSVLVCI